MGVRLALRLDASHQKQAATCPRRRPARATLGLRISGRQTMAQIDALDIRPCTASLSLRLAIVRRLGRADIAL